MDRPKITDKVRFWEEQDKINQAMIPRMLEMHEVVNKTSLLAQKNSSDQIALSVKLKSLEDRYYVFDTRLSETNEAVKKTSALAQKGVTEIATLLNKVMELERRSNAFDTSIFEMTEAVEKTSFSAHESEVGVASLATKIQELENRFNAFDPSGKAKINVWNAISVAMGVVAILIAVFK